MSLILYRHFESRGKDPDNLRNYYKARYIIYDDILRTSDLSQLSEKEHSRLLRKRNNSNDKIYELWDLNQ